MRTDRGMRLPQGLEGLFCLDIDESRLGIAAASLRS